MSATLASAAAAIYLLAVGGIAASGGRSKTSMTSALALVLHGAALASGLVQDGNLTVGVTEALSLFTWQAAAFLWAVCLFQDLQVLALAAYPCAAAAAVGAALWPTWVTAIPLLDWKLQLHVVLSLFAAGFLSLAAIQATVLVIQDRQLHGASAPDGRLRLPPLQTMETVLFQMIAAGYFMLSLSLATGILFVDDLLAQHLAHKTVLTILAWLIFGGLLLGRWRGGWRGRTAFRWTLSGYGVLILGYFGSKLVLEIILGRHWT